MSGPLLVLDSGSPLVSVAIGHGGEILAQRTEEIARSGGRLLAMVDEALRAAGLTVRDLGGIAALAGPGSFTGLRIGLATVLGLHQAVGLPATTLPTLQVLASIASLAGEGGEGRAFGAVDSLRGEWMVEPWRDGRGLGAHLVAEAELAHYGPGRVAGFGIARLQQIAGWPPNLRLIEPGPLAPAALPLAAALAAAEWNPERLTTPIYARPPAATPLRPAAPRPAA